MAEFELASRLIDNKIWKYVVLYNHMMTEYLNEFDDPPIRAYKNLGCLGGPYEDDGWPIQMQIAILPFGLMPEFRSWCMARGVTINAKKKQIDREKIWWPIVIEVLAEPDNQYLVWAHLSTQY